ncbi:MAG: MarR family winged helix-turn-helix transcriptional regulator [Chthoniobacterales bacterium]
MAAIDPETIGQLVQETARVWRHKLDQRLRPLGLSQAKWRTIAHLAQGELKQCDLAERLSIEEPTLARLLSSMETGGWVKRENARQDRRCKTVHLQRKSSRLLERIEGTARQLRHELLAEISPKDLQACLRVLAEVRQKAATVEAKASNGQREIRKP